jgi:hypothetical protein
VRLPTFSRQSDSDNTDRDRPTAPVRNDGAHTVAAPDDATTTRFTTAGAAAERASAGRAAAQADRAAAQADRAQADRAAAHTERTETERAATYRGTDRDTSRAGALDTDEPTLTDREPVVAGPKPRASLLATLGLVLAVGGALLVLSGPLLGYGIAVSALALILSVAGLRATRRRHVAGKTDALIGTILSLAAIVVGVLALSGMLTWLGTDMQPVNSLREWLDAQFVDRF